MLTLTSVGGGTGGDIGNGRSNGELSDSCNEGSELKRLEHGVGSEERICEVERRGTLVEDVFSARLYTFRTKVHHEDRVGSGASIWCPANSTNYSIFSRQNLTFGRYEWT